MRELLDLAYQKIHFVDDAEIPIPVYMEAAQWVRDVDMDDLVFVALNNHLGSVLWTGDTKLFRHLVGRGYERVVNFEELKELYE